MADGFGATLGEGAGEGLLVGVAFEQLQELSLGDVLLGEARTGRLQAEPRARRALGERLEQLGVASGELAQIVDRIRERLQRLPEIAGRQLVQAGLDRLLNGLLEARQHSAVDLLEHGLTRSLAMVVVAVLTNVSRVLRFHDNTISGR